MMTIDELYRHFDSEVLSWMNKYNIQFKITDIGIDQEAKKWVIYYSLERNGRVFTNVYYTIDKEFPNQWDILSDIKSSKAVETVLGMKETLPVSMFFGSLMELTCHIVNNKSLIEFSNTQGLSVLEQWVYYAYARCISVTRDFKRLFKDNGEFISAYQELEAISLLEGFEEGKD